MISKKICLVGDFGVGKTSLIRRFVDRQFSDQYLSTVGVKISRRMVNLLDKPLNVQRSVQFLIWDIEGSTKFKGISPAYFQGAKGAVIVGDITRQETIAHLLDHFHSFCSVNPGEKVILALNKADLVDSDKRSHLLQQLQFKKPENLLEIYTTSAKTGENVDEIFQLLAQHLI